MARPISWLPRLAEIRRTVMNSKRELYDSLALEKLFGIQRRGVGNLVAVLPAVKVGASLVVERDVLARFLEELSKAEDPAAAYAKRRRGKKPPRKSKLMVRRQLITEGSLVSLPDTVKLRPGHIEFQYGSKLELLESMAMFLGAVENDEDVFLEKYVTGQPNSAQRAKFREEVRDARRLFAELRQMEANKDKGAN
jgi:hypothetical protein